MYELFSIEIITQESGAGSLKLTILFVIQKLEATNLLSTSKIFITWVELTIMVSFIGSSNEPMNETVIAFLLTLIFSLPFDSV